MRHEPRGELPPDVEKATRQIHRAVWSEDYVPGRGSMHYATGPYWPDELLRLADLWERQAAAARVCSVYLSGAELMRMAAVAAEHAEALKEGAGE